MTIQTPPRPSRLPGRRAAAAGGFSLGFSFPFAPAEAAEVQELNAWVVIHPDDKVVIRIARSEMGQGTLTGLCQLVAEELECDWSKITTEYPTPGENVQRGRVWKNFSTGGSRGIRESNQYVREGGAMARDDADRGGGGRMESAGGRVHGGQQRRHPQARARSSPTAISPPRRPSSSRPRR